MEIERKFLVDNLPFVTGRFDAKKMSQAYVSFDPVIRIRRVETEAGVADAPGGESSCADSVTYELTVKGRGLMAREEINLSLSEKAYLMLSGKTEGCVIEKDRLMIPLDGALVCELDIFYGDLAPLMMAEVEFDSEEAAQVFTPPDWFGPEVTFDPAYQNCNLARHGKPTGN